MALSWLKKGEDSLSVAKQEELDALKRQEESGKLFRFWLNKEESAKITFVDGDINPEHGVLTPPRFFEHQVFINGKWDTFVCPEKTCPESGDKCPICASGDRPSLVSLFTVIDHRIYKSKDGSKTYQDTRKLFVAKPGTMEILQKLAIKRGGLAGARFEISRTGEKAPAVGNLFDFEEKLPIDQLKAKYKDETVDPTTKAKTVKTYFEAANYEQEIIFRDGATLAKMGVGTPTAGGTTTNISSPDGSSVSSSVDYDSQL
jgi:hypothetical protein